MSRGLLQGWRAVAAEPGVGVGEADAEADAVAPAECGEAGHVEQLARRAVRLRGVEAEHALEAHSLRDGLGQLADSHVRARPNVDWRGIRVVPEQEDAGVGEVVDVEELAAGGAAAPD